MGHWSVAKHDSHLPDSIIYIFNPIIQKQMESESFTQKYKLNRAVFVIFSWIDQVFMWIRNWSGNQLIDLRLKSYLMTVHL